MSFSNPTNGQKYVTIVTDISCDSTFRVATWACYIRYNGGVIKKTGVFSAYPSDTCRAETYALINALTIAEKSISDWSESRIIIHNEVERVLTPLRKKSGNLNKKELDRTEAIMTLAMPILDRAQSWERRKIKAHFKEWQESENPAKYALNRWCDRASRDLMRYHRRLKKNSLKSLDNLTR